MSLLSTLNHQDFNTLREQWETQLKAELKLADLGNKGFKSSIDGGLWPTLSLERRHSTHVPVVESWKRASQTYVTAPTETQIEDDLSHGVRNFFFYKNQIGALKGQLPEDGEIFILDGSELSGVQIDRLGGTLTLELAMLTAKLIERLPEIESDQIDLFVSTDAQFFRNIAKIRAAKLLALKVLEESGVRKTIRLITLTSFKEWTLYERYSNMLRNVSALASAYIGGADQAQSCGYNVLHEIETGTVDPTHQERSLRMARNTAHILALESALGIVQDAAHGSYHLENLTEEFAAAAWAEMQKLLPLNEKERSSYIDQQCLKTRNERLKQVKTRKHVLAGINDFPDAEERLGLKSIPKEEFFRVARDFENLRIRMELSTSPPQVHLAAIGNLAALNARLNFTKNYFQLLGLKVHEYYSVEDVVNKAGVVVLCALDDDYASIPEMKFLSQQKFIAGKVERNGFRNLYAGQNVLEVLEAIG